MYTQVEERTRVDQMIESAVAFCARKVFAGDTDRALAMLRQGRCDVCDYLRYGLARQIGDYLGRTDSTIKAVYLFEGEPDEGNEPAPNSPARASGISLIAWVDRKTAALSALAAALETNLAHGRRAIGCPLARPSCYFLDVHMVDDADIRDHRGYAAVLDGLHVRPLEVWTRHN